MVRGYIKQIESVNVAPTEIYFTYEDDERRHSLEEVLALREEDWFSKGVALAPECNRHIVDASILRMQALRAESPTRLKHQIIAVACSIAHARQIRSYYEEKNVRAAVIHSNMSAEEQKRVLEDLRNYRIDCIVQVQKLGEGFDHPPLSAAAIFRPFRSLSPYIQFVGRVMRVNVQNEPQHPDNRGLLISHVGLNIDYLWSDFKELDEADQPLVHDWLNNQGGDNGTGGGGGTEETPRPVRVTPEMVVHGEIVDQFIQDTFLDPNDDLVIEEMMNRIAELGVDPESMGLTREELRRRMQQQQAANRVKPDTIPVDPQLRRQQSRIRLTEMTRTVANRVLMELGLSADGYQLARAVASEAGGNGNLVALIRILNRAVNDFLKIDRSFRGETSFAQNEQALSNLDAIGDQVRERLREALKK